MRFRGTNRSIDRKVAMLELGFEEMQGTPLAAAHSRGLG
jgi:argininosuccinate lyase